MSTNIIKQKNEVTIFNNGQAFISQRKAEKLLGLNNGTLRKHISRHHKNTNTINGLSPELLFSVTTYYAIQSRKTTNEAKDLIIKIGSAGAKAYLYHLAGYEMMAEKPQNQETKKIAYKPQDFIESADMIANMLNVQGVEKVKLLSNVLSNNGYNGIAKALPSYENTKFAGTLGEVSARVAHAYSYHKKQRGFELSAIAFNKLLHSEGILKREETSSGKKFWSITKSGLKYGKNVVSKQSSNTTQPHWYDDTIEELYNSFTE